MTTVLQPKIINVRSWRGDTCQRLCFCHDSLATSVTSATLCIVDASGATVHSVAEVSPTYTQFTIGNYSGCVNNPAALANGTYKYEIKITVGGKVCVVQAGCWEIDGYC